MRNKNVNVLFIISAAVCFVIRLLQLLYTVDFKTGFFIKDMKTAGVLLSVFVFAAMLILFLLAFFGTRERKKGGRKLYGIASAVLGLAIIYDLVSFDITEYVLKPYYVCMLIFGTLSVLCLFFDTYLAFSENKNRGTAFFAAVIAFYIVKLIIIFTSYATVSTVCSHIYEIAALCLTTLFMLCHGKYLNGFEGKYTVRLSYASALAGAVALVVLTAPAVVPEANTRTTFIASNAATVFYMLAAFSCYGDENDETEE